MAAYLKYVDMLSAYQSMPMNFACYVSNHPNSHLIFCPIAQYAFQTQVSHGSLTNNIGKIKRMSPTLGGSTKHANPSISLSFKNKKTIIVCF